MDKTLTRISSIVALILIVLGTAYQIVVLYQGDTAIGANTDSSNSILNGFFYVAYVALIVAVLFAILFPVVQMISNPKGAITTLIVLAAAVVLWFIVYGIAGNSFSPVQLEKMKITAETSKMVGAGLIYAYIIFGIAILAIIFSSIRSIFK